MCAFSPSRATTLPERRKIFSREKCLAWLWSQIDGKKCPPSPGDALQVKVSRAD